MFSHKCPRRTWVSH